MDLQIFADIYIEKLDAGFVELSLQKKVQNQGCTQEGGGNKGVLDLPSPPPPNLDKVEGIGEQVREIRKR